MYAIAKDREISTEHYPTFSEAFANLSISICQYILSHRAHSQYDETERVYRIKVNNETHTWGIVKVKKQMELV